MFFFNNFIFELNFFGLSLSVFIIGLYGIIVMKRSVLRILISLELMLLGLNLNFIFYSIYLDDLVGQIFSLVILTVAAAESSIGLAILMIHYRLTNTSSLDYINFFKRLKII